MTGTAHDIEGLVARLGPGVKVETHPALVKQKSRDFFWYSPILNAQLHGKSADVLVSPRHEADVIRVAAACARFGVPILTFVDTSGAYPGIEAEERGQAEAIAANIDLVVVAVPLTESVRLRKLERYLVFARTSGAEVVVVLTNQDQTMVPAIQRSEAITTGA